MLAIVLLILPASLLSVELVRVAMLRRGRLDRPRQERWSRAATPSSGGLGFVPWFILGSLLLTRHRLSLLSCACALAMLVLGAIDDRRGLGPGTKLSVQILVSIGAAAAGAVLPVSGNATLDAAMTVAFIVVVTNAFNFSDNMDGLAAGLALVAALAIAYLFYLREQPHGMWVALALASALAGFWLSNAPPARIFMGDAGSLAIGMALALLAVQAVGGSPRSLGAAAVAVLLFFVPLFDVALVFIARHLGGRPLLQGGTDHASHRLVRLGLSTHGVLVTAYAVATAAAWIALWLSQGLSQGLSQDGMQP